MDHETERHGRTAVLLEPHPICHASISSLLERCDTEVVGAAATAFAAAALLDEHNPCVLVAELDLPEGRREALHVIARGRRANPSLTVIVLSGSDDSTLIDRAFEAGAAAYILKTSDPEAVATAIRQAYEPSIYLARSREPRAASLPAQESLPQLTRRELEILRLVSEGRSNRQVGQLLWVTDQTVKFHLANIYRKLGVGSRHDAARWAHENGVLTTPSNEAPGDAAAQVGRVAEPENGNGNANGNGTLPLRRIVPLRSLSRELRGGTSR